MKRFFIISSSLILSVLIFTSCATITGQGPENNEGLYKAAIERYYNAVLQVDVDTFLDSLDPLGPLYPNDTYIKQLRDKAVNGAYPGEVAVKELTVLEESDTRAKVKVTLFIRVDVDRSGNFYEDTFTPTFDLTCKDGVWRIFGGTK
jgi:hypothetical protein